jgi:AcrR family transcriptional regulator
VNAGAAPVRGVERALASRRRKYEDEMERVVKATFEVMREQDSANPSVADILATAGLSTAAFYRHFPTKDDLLVLLLERAHQRTRQRLEEQLVDYPEPIDRIAAWVRALFDMVRNDEALSTNRPFLLAHSRLLERFPDEIENGFSALSSLLAAAVAEATGTQVADVTGDARLAMHHVFGIIVDLAALRRAPEDDFIESVALYTQRALVGATHSERKGRRGGRPTR